MKTIPQLEKELRNWQNAFPGQTPEEAKQKLESALKKPKMVDASTQTELTGADEENRPKKFCKHAQKYYNHQFTQEVSSPETNFSGSQSEQSENIRTATNLLQSCQKLEDSAYDTKRKFVSSELKEPSLGFENKSLKLKNKNLESENKELKTKVERLERAIEELEQLNSQIQCSQSSERENAQLKEQVQILTQRLEQINMIAQIEIPPK